MGMLGAFYDTFVGAGSFAAGAAADRFGYGSVFVMAAVAICTAAIEGVVVYRTLSDRAIACFETQPQDNRTVFT
jgi:hypothetical protein